MITEAEKPRICRWQAEDPGEQMLQFQSEFEGLRTRRANGTNYDPRPSPKAGDD